MSDYYHSTRILTVDAPPLIGAQQANVAIIGGGLTGCSAALHLAERGYRVTLLEAGTLGSGASGRNGGQVLPGLACGQLKLNQLIGKQAARHVWDLSIEAVDLLRHQISRFAIDCDFTPGYLHAAVKPRQVRELAETQAELADLGYPATDLLTGAHLRARLASPRYLAALTDPVSGHLHPLNYTLGLAQAAIRAGAALHAHSKVSSIEPGNNPGAKIRLRTAQGEVTADYVIIATGAYLAGLMPPLAGYIMPVGTYIIATEPRNDVPALIPGNDAVADLNFVLDYFRRSPDHRMLFGGRVSYSTVPPTNLAAAMLARARTVFPALASARADYCWGGFVDITMNRAPHFGRIGNNILFMHGFSGHGVALTGLAGKLAAEAIAGQAERFDVFAQIPHHRFPGGPLLRTPLLLLATSWFRLRDLL